MKATRNQTLIFIIIQALVICVLLIFFLIRLVFKRLEEMKEKAFRVVGGDYYTSIATNSNDEVGQFENLFDQFRAVFVSILEQINHIDKK